jgi:hypothetical protein
LHPAFESAKQEIASLASQFAGAARRMLVESLDRAVERLIVTHDDWFLRLDDQMRKAFREAVDRAIKEGANEAAKSVEDVDPWLSPKAVMVRVPARRSMTEPIGSGSGC